MSQHKNQLGLMLLLCFHIWFVLCVDDSIWERITTLFIDRIISEDWSCLDYFYADFVYFLDLETFGPHWLSLYEQKNAKTFFSVLQKKMSKGEITFTVICQIFANEIQ